MRRREFLRAATGAAGAAAAATGGASAQETATPSPTETSGGAEDGSGATVQMDLVDFAYEPGTEEPLTIPPGTTVEFVWQTPSHNINVDSQPDGSDWEGHMPVENTGFETSHTFEVEGTYEFHCDPHQSLGMEGTIEVQEGAALPGEGGGGGGGGGEVDPEHMGVPIQAHFVGLATILMLGVSLVFTFFLLKYGETPHSGYPKR
ncbi:MAG: plastocyanin/azurin family copper-binding protein [Halobacteriales archaeon]|nr:plastocyanin/azurin family copper-binding protein [Halobacteriales archaeon]